MTRRIRRGRLKVANHERVTVTRRAPALVAARRAEPVVHQVEHLDARVGHVLRDERAVLGAERERPVEHVPRE
jgi:hypothetical protein